MMNSGTRKIRVLQCIRQGQVGGGETHLLSLVENMDIGLYEPYVLSFTEGPMVDRLRKMDIEVTVIHTEKPFDIRVWPRVTTLIRKKGIQLVHAHGTRAASNVFWGTQRIKLPLVYTIHGWSFHDDQHPLVKSIRVMGEKYLTGVSNINISVSRSNQETGKRLIRSFESEVVYNGIDLKRFDIHGSYADVRHELGIGADRKLVLFLARFTAHKQPLVLLKSFMDVYKNDPELHLLMVGEGDQLQTAKKIVADRGMEHCVTFSPFRMDVPAVLSAADLYVLPSLWEGMPIGLLEAMAMGKAVIASNVDGTREIVKHEQNGFLIPVNELEDRLGRAIMDIFGDKERLSRFQQNAHESVARSFNVTDMARSIERIYRKLV